MPAEQTRMSTPPHVSAAKCASACRSADERTSVLRACTWKPAWRRSLSVWARPSPMSPITTAAPPAASRSAVARPMPVAPPVTMATWPSNSRSLLTADLQGEMEQTGAARLDLHRCPVGDGLREAVGGIAGERLQAHGIETAVPGMHPRSPELLPEPEIRHGRRVPLDANAQAFFRTDELVPPFAEAGQVDDIAGR